MKNDMDEEIIILQQKIARDAFFERLFDRILYGGDLKYAPARHLVKPLLIPPKTKIPKVKFVDIDGTLIQQQEWDRRTRLAQFMLYMRSNEENRQWMREEMKWH